MHNASPDSRQKPCESRIDDVSSVQTEPQAPAISAAPANLDQRPMGAHVRMPVAAAIEGISHDKAAAAAQKSITQAPEISAALVNFDRLPNAAHVRLPVVAALNGISPATVWRWVKSGRLPAPSKLGPKTTAWKVGDLRRAMSLEVA